MIAFDCSADSAIQLNFKVRINLDLTTQTFQEADLRMFVVESQTLVADCICDDHCISD